MPNVRKWEDDGVAWDTHGFEQSQWLRDWCNFNDFYLALDREDKQQLEKSQILPQGTQVINLAPSSEQWIVENWTLTNSFHAAYITWDESNTVGAYPQQNQLESEFEYDEFSLSEFYNLSLESTQEFQTGTIEHETTITVELNKNPFSITTQAIDQNIFSSIDSTFAPLPSPYVTADFASKKNYLGLSIEHEANLTKRLSFSLEVTLDIAISDTTAIAELNLVEPIENTNFYPEIALDYQLTDSLLAYASFAYSSEPIVGVDSRNRLLRSEVYQGFELGIEAQLSDNWLAEISFEGEIQHNITTSDPNEPEFDLQIDRQISNSWTGEIRGEITSGWWLSGFYTYTNATVTKDQDIPRGNSIEGFARHRGGFWTSYQINQGVGQGFGFGGGVVVNGDRPGDAINSFNFPGYLQTDLAIFYTQDQFKAAISLQNVFDAGLEDDEVTPQTISGTVSWEF